MWHGNMRRNLRTTVSLTEGLYDQVFIDHSPDEMQPGPEAEASATNVPRIGRDERPKQDHVQRRTDYSHVPALPHDPSNRCAACVHKTAAVQVLIL